jgi:cold shock CspA family protein
MRCHVIVDSPHQHHHQGGLFKVVIDVTVPEAEIVTDRAHPRSHAHEDPYVALRDAFRATRRQLEDYERTHRLDVKTHVGQPRGRIAELDREGGHGRIETADGRFVYFHRNSVVDADFDELAVGVEVRFAEEAGDQGPQASSLHVIGRRRSS